MLPKGADAPNGASGDEDRPTTPVHRQATMCDDLSNSANSANSANRTVPSEA